MKTKTDLNKAVILLIDDVGFFSRETQSIYVVSKLTCLSKLQPRQMQLSPKL
jgi:hypothetical protein